MILTPTKLTNVLSLNPSKGSNVSPSKGPNPILEFFYFCFDFSPIVEPFFVVFLWGEEKKRKEKKLKAVCPCKPLGEGGWDGGRAGSQSVENARCLLPRFPLGKGFEAKYNLVETWHIFIRVLIIRV